MPAYFFDGRDVGLCGCLESEAARAQHEHAEHFLNAPETCAGCLVQCDSCFKHCLTLLTDGKKEHAKRGDLQ